jgi:hypothetical protein
MPEVRRVSLRAALAAIAIIAVAIKIAPAAMLVAVWYTLIFSVMAIFAYIPTYGVNRAIGPMRPNSFLIVFLIFEAIEGAFLGWFMSAFFTGPR